jgi:hypothetical protein
MRHSITKGIDLPLDSPKKYRNDEKYTEEFPFESFPAEIWIIILSFLQIRDICTLNRTCKWFYDLITTPSPLWNSVKILVGFSVEDPLYISTYSSRLQNFGDKVEARLC